MTKVAIGIATCKRPRMLQETLRAVERLVTDAHIRVLVVDNDATKREGTYVVKGTVASGYRWPLSSAVVNQRGFTYARNRLVEWAFSDPHTDFIAVLDDDQTPDRDWLDAMLRVVEETHSDVVAPAVWPTFEVTPPDWVTNSGLFERDTSTTGLVDSLYGDGGTLLSRRVERFVVFPWYDNRFALSGGADAELFERLRGLGARFARARDAVVHENYPASRLRVSWVLSRAYRIGNADVRIAMSRRPRLMLMCRESVKIIGAICVTPLLVVGNLGHRGRQIRALCKLARAVGKTAALIGRKYDEYAVIHGD